MTRAGTTRRWLLSRFPGSTNHTWNQDSSHGENAQEAERAASWAAPGIPGTFLRASRRPWPTHGSTAPTAAARQFGTQFRILPWGMREGVRGAVRGVHGGATEAVRQGAAFDTQSATSL